MILKAYVGVTKRWVNEVVSFFVMWLRLLWIRGLGITLMGVVGTISPSI